MELSQGEKLILLMLCEIQEHLKLKGETDISLIRKAIYSGNLWGLEWAMPGVFHGSETPEEIVIDAQNIMSMWQRLEESFDNLKPADKKWLADNAALGKHVRFSGWDGNGQIEVQYISAARFLVDHLDKFEIFKGRDLNAHMPMLDAYRRMLEVFDPILHRVTNQDFTAAQIAEVMNAAVHPENRETK